VAIFWVKSSINWPKFFSSAFLKYNNFQFFEICGDKKKEFQHIFSHYILLLFLESGMGKNQDPGQTSRICNTAEQKFINDLPALRRTSSCSKTREQRQTMASYPGYSWTITGLYIARQRDWYRMVPFQKGTQIKQTV
jgi:hypothetical protein